MFALELRVFARREAIVTVFCFFAWRKVSTRSGVVISYTEVHLSFFS